ncbi:hypothetical protein [Bartonella grahamii]|nr:hypothetical protein [Bartonella grahamii]
MKYFGEDAQYDGEKWTAPTYKLKTFKEDGTEDEKKAMIMLVQLLLV